MIYVGSRYEREEVFFTLDSRSGMTRPTVMREAKPVRRPRRATRSIKWEDGLRLDMLAQKSTGSAEKWWVMVDANPDILDPMSITPGTSVVLP